MPPVTGSGSGTRMESAAGSSKSMNSFIDPSHHAELELLGKHSKGETVRQPKAKLSPGFSVKRNPNTLIYFQKVEPVIVAAAQISSTSATKVDENLYRRARSIYDLSASVSSPLPSQTSMAWVRPIRMKSSELLAIVLSKLALVPLSGLKSSW